MTNKKYIRGVGFEREVMKIFKEHGFVVLRTAGSHSPFDVILIKYAKDERSDFNRIAHITLVQCKTEKKK